MNYNGITMTYQKIKNLLQNTPNQPGRFRTKIGLRQVMNHMDLKTLHLLTA